MSSIKLNDEVRSASLFVASSRSAIKNRKRTGETGDLCGMPVFTFIGSVSPS